MCLKAYLIYPLNLSVSQKILPLTTDHTLLIGALCSILNYYKHSGDAGLRSLYAFKTGLMSSHKCGNFHAIEKQICNGNNANLMAKI